MQSIDTPPAADHTWYSPLGNCFISEKSKQKYLWGNWVREVEKPTAYRRLRLKMIVSMSEHASKPIRCRWYFPVSIGYVWACHMLQSSGEVRDLAGAGKRRLCIPSMQKRIDRGEFTAMDCRKVGRWTYMTSLTG